jgi:hypothetical protein
LIRNNGNHPAAPQPPDIWTWDGSKWAHPSAANAPAAWGSAVYDTARSVVLFYGQDQSLNLSTWSYDGGTWTKLTSVLGPGAAFDDAPPMATFGSASAPTLVGNAGEVWEWGADDWVKQPGSAPLPELIGYSVTFDSARGVILLFGGGVPATSAPPTPTNQTWTWDGRSWTRGD